MTEFSQLDHPGVSSGRYGVPGFLSDVRREPAAGFADGRFSLDQLAEVELGGLIRVPSLSLGVGGGDAISWTRSGIAVSKVEEPSKSFQLLFQA